MNYAILYLYYLIEYLQIENSEATLVKFDG